MVWYVTLGMNGILYNTSMHIILYVGFSKSSDGTNTGYLSNVNGAY